MVATPGLGDGKPLAIFRQRSVRIEAVGPVPRILVIDGERSFEQSAAPLQITTQQNRADRDRTGDGANCAMEYVFQFDDE